MCKVVVGIQNKPTQEFADLIRAQETDLKREDDGISALVVSYDGKVETFRSLLDYDSIFAKVYDKVSGSKIVAIHTRTATTGDVCLDNTHLQDINDWFLAHNGWVTGYSGTIPKYTGEWKKNSKSTPTIYTINDDVDVGVDSLSDNLDDDIEEFESETARCKGCKSSKKRLCKLHRADLEIINDATMKTLDLSFEDEDKSKKSDSLQFLEGITKQPITVKSLEQDIEDKKFSGFGFLFNKITKEIYFLIHKTSYIVQGNDYGLLTSYVPEKDTSVVKYDNFKGIPYEVESEKIEIDREHFELGEGVFKMNLRFPKSKSKRSQDK